MNGITTVKDAAVSYFRSGFMVFDLVATIPSSILLFLNRDTSKHLRKYFMLLRFSHWSQFFFPIIFVMDRYINIQPVIKAKYLSLVEVFMFILILGHFMACMWVILGNRDQDEGKSWRIAMEMPKPEVDSSFIWVTAYYEMFEVYSTVGYGDMSYGTNFEYWFILLCEFIGVAYMSVLLIKLSGLFESYDYEGLLDEKMDQLMFWSKKLELCNRLEKDTVYLDPHLYLEMQRFVKDAFLYDFNLIVEEFNLYQLLPPRY